MSFLLVVPLFVTHCPSLSFAVIRCHSLSLVVPLVVIRCHSLSLVVTRCTSRLSIYKRCSNNRPCLCIPYLSLLFFIYLQVRLRTTWNIKDVNFCSNKKPLTRTYFIHLRYPSAIMAFLRKHKLYSLIKSQKTTCNLGRVQSSKCGKSGKINNKAPQLWTFNELSRISLLN